MMSPTLLDTDTVSLLLRRQPLVVEQARQYMVANGVLQFSIITYYESLSGLLYRDARQQMQQFQQLAALHQVVPLTIEAVTISAQIEATLRSRGQSISPLIRSLPASRWLTVCSLPPITPGTLAALTGCN